MRTSTRSRFGSLVGTLLVCLSAALILSSCKKSPEQKILGKWDVQGEPSVVEYRKDGTFVTTQNGQSMAGRYRFADDSHLELELSGKMGTNTITMRLNCQVAFHDDMVDVTATIAGKPGMPPVAKTIHYIRAK